MRLNRDIQMFLKKKIKGYLPNAAIFLFGSRVDDNKKGGDIDILIVDEQKLGFIEKHEIIAAFWKNFGEQKIDILSYTAGDDDPFFLSIREKAVEIDPETV